MVLLIQELKIKRFSPAPPKGEKQFTVSHFLLWALLWVGIILVIALMALLRNNADAIFSFCFQFLGTATGLFVVIVLVLAKFVHRINRRTFEKHFATGRVRPLFEERTVILTEEGVSMTNPLYTSMTRWAGVEEVVETDHFIFFYTDINAALSIPKRVFLDESEKEAFLDLAQTYHAQRGPSSSSVSVTTKPSPTGIIELQKGFINKGNLP